MNPMQILIDTFLYFAKFPQLAGVKKSFNTDRQKIDGYDVFKTRVDDLENGDNSLCPEIIDYVFGVDEKRVKKRIEEFGDYYFFLDYGQVQKTQNQRYGNVTNSFFIALTVARPFSEQEMDDAEEILITQKCYELLQKIYDYLRADRGCPIMKWDFTSGIMPFYAPILNNSIGWTLELTREGNLQD